MIHILGFAGVAMIMLGCAAGPETRRPMAGPGETYTLYPPHAVLDSRRVHDARRSTASSPDPSALAVHPWWETRNDHRLNIRPNGAAMSSTAYEIYIDDAQRSFGDEIFNRHRRIFRSVERGVSYD